MSAPDFNAQRHPVLAVACPTCRARIGAWCKRPSGHKAMRLHRGRGMAADLAWEKAGCPEICPHRTIEAENQAEEDPATVPPIDPLEGNTFAELVAALELRQVDVARLLRSLGGSGDVVTVNRWFKGRQAAPPAVIAMLRLFAMLPERRRAALLRQAREP